MPAIERDPPAIRCCLALFRFIRFIVPAATRDAWIQEWDAEVRHRWARMRREDDTEWSRQVHLVRQSAGALADAAWLRQQFTVDLDLLHDVRHASRVLRHRPAVSALAILVLALGIGGTVAVFSIVDLLMLRSLPYRETDRIVTLWQAPRDNPDDRSGVAPGAFLDWRERTTAFAPLAAADPFSWDYLGGPEPVSLVGALVTPGFFDALGVQPFLGRSFLPEEFQAGRSDVVVLSFGAWQRLTGGDPASVGRRLMLGRDGGRPYLVVGVLPEWFHPDLPRRAKEQEVWAPKVVQDFERTIRGSRYWVVVGRLAEGRELGQARTELASISARLAQEYPRSMGRMVATMVPFRQHLGEPIRDAVLALLGAVILVLLIACANVASLLVARGAERQQEFAIRAAIGAGRWRLVRQLLVESFILAALGCGLSIALARSAVHAFAIFGSNTVRQLNDLSVDERLLVFAIGVGASTAVLSGLWPAVQLSKHATRNQVQQASTGTVTSRRRLSSVLVVVEIALALVLLAGAGLLLRSFAAVARVDPGFESSNVAVLQVFAYGSRYRNDGQRVAFFDQALERVRALPGVESAGLISAMPLVAADMNIRGPIRLEGRPVPGADDQSVVSLTIATAEYFQALRIPVRRGRLFSPADRLNAPLVAVVSELMARRLWPAEDALHQRFSVNWQGQWKALEVVGVVGESRHEGLDHDPRSEVFMPFAQVPYGSMTIVVRTASDPGALILPIKERIWSVDPTLPFYDTATLDGLVTQSLSPRRMMMQLLGGFALLAFVLAAAGIYGVLSFSTSQRTREIGLRIAVGARTSDILAMIVHEGMTLVGVGVVVGLGVALATTRILSASLYQVSPTDPATLAAVTLLFAAAALAACYVPARRAMRLDPLTALRSQ